LHLKKPKDLPYGYAVWEILSVDKSKKQCYYVINKVLAQICWHICQKSRQVFVQSYKSEFFSKKLKPKRHFSVLDS